MGTTRVPVTRKTKPTSGCLPLRLALREPGHSSQESWTKFKVPSSTQLKQGPTRAWWIVILPVDSVSSRPTSAKGWVCVCVAAEFHSQFLG